MWERPNRSAWFESRAAVVNLFQGQHVGGGPEPIFQRGRILFRQARTANFRSSGDIIVVERAMLNNDVILFDTQETEPDPRRPIVRGHPDGPRVMPQLPINCLSERQTAMTCDNPIGPGLPNLLRFDRCRRRRKNEAVDGVDTSMDHGKSITADLNVDPLRQP